MILGVLLGVLLLPVPAPAARNTADVTLTIRLISTAGRITEVVLDLNGIHKWDNSNGDTWDPFWAADGNLYAFNCDGRGFGKEMRNLALEPASAGKVDEMKAQLFAWHKPEAAPR